MLDPAIRNFHKAVINEAAQKLDRTLTQREEKFITSRGSFVALEMISDYVKAETKEKIETYLNSK